MGKSDDQRRDAATLRDLRAEHPRLTITTGFYGATRVWEARGDNGHPWLVTSDNLTRFRAALGEPR
jgi:hypothetical protein